MSSAPPQALFEYHTEQPFSQEMELEMKQSDDERVSAEAERVFVKINNEGNKISGSEENFSETNSGLIAPPVHVHTQEPDEIEVTLDVDDHQPRKLLVNSKTKSL